MPDKKLSSGRRKVRSRKQETDFYCGPAVAQMTLGGLGITRTQDHLWDAIQDEFDALGLPRCEPCEPVECSPWSTPPEALAAVLGRLGKQPIKLVNETDVAAADHAVVWSVTSDVAASVLVYGWRHWVIVYGYRVDRPPTSATDTGYLLQGFHVRDPWPQTPATRFVSATQWRQAYLTGVPCGRFTNRFVAVCDPDAPLPKGGPAVPKPKTPGERLVSPQAAVQAALEGIGEAGLLAHDVWRQAMKQAKPGTPRLVHRLDDPRSFYYLVPFARGSTVTVQAMVDAASAEFLEAQAAEGARRSLVVADPPAVASDALARRRLDVPGWRRHALLRREGLAASPTLVWRPCRESLSPYVPFTMLTYGDKPIYMRADREVFTTLTELDPGN